jgi:hypothetical protein
MPISTRHAPVIIRFRKGEERNTPMTRPLPGVLPEKVVDDCAGNRAAHGREGSTATERSEAGWPRQRPGLARVPADPVAPLDIFPEAGGHHLGIALGDGAWYANQAEPIELASLLSRQHVSRGGASPLARPSIGSGTR